MTYYMAGEGRRLFGQTTPSELPRQVQHERAHADRRRRRDHAVELPDRDPVVEARSRRSSAATPSCSSRRRTRRCSRERFVELLARGGRPRRRRQHRARLRRAASATRSSAIRTCRVITFTGSRETGVAVHEGGGRQPQARPPRARRQERDHRHGRRRPRPRGRRHRLVGVRHVRPALHRRVARDRARGGLRRAAVEARRARPRGCGSARAGRTTPTSAR